MAERKIGKGLQEKRSRILRSLDAHLRYLAMLETLQHWEPPPHVARPPRPPDPDPYRQRPASWFWSPRDKPELAHPVDGLAEITDAQIAEWIAVDPFVRKGLKPATQRAMAFIETFRPQA